MADPAVAALNTLLRGADIDDHADVLKIANAAIKASKPSSPDLVTAQHARVVALLKLDRFSDALRAIVEGGASLQKACALEKAYALYKTGQLDAAEVTLQDAGVGRGMKHVAAQVAYRAEKFEKAAAIYRDLGDIDDEGQAGEENDLRINLSAANAQLEWQGKGWAVPADQKQPGREDLEAFETAYNAACGCISRGDFAKAAVLLKRSRDLCEATDDLDEDEKKTELVPILVQQAYVYAKLGKLAEAANLHKSIILSDVSDSSTKLIAQSNALVLQAESNPFMAQRLFESLPEASGADRLFQYQSSTLRHNKFVIALQAQKFSGVKKTTTSILSDESVPVTTAAKADLGVLNAAAASQLKTGKDALHHILPLLETRPNDVGLLLTVIQLYIQLQNPSPALNILEAFFKRLETATTADHADADTSAIRKEFAKAAAHWQRKESASAAGSGSSLVREAGIELLRSAHPADLAAAGGGLLNTSLRPQPGDRTATAGLVASFATSDFAKVQPHLGTLPPVEKLIDGIDVDALIDAGVAVLPVAAPTAASLGKKRSLDESGADKGQQQPAKKRRKRKLPKNYDPNKKPDPERWLPLRDRSTYRPKGKKGKKRAAEATQGGVVKEEETLELAGGAGSVKVEKAPGAALVVGRKKKKKGKK